MSQLDENISIEEVAKLVNAKLESYFETLKVNAARHKSHARLVENYQDFVVNGGKRIRPYLVALVADANGKGRDDGTIQIATAWELVHQATLIHDDIIDRDYVRRGKPNINGLYRQQYARPMVKDVDIEHYADSAAILAGDLAISSGYQMMIEADIPTNQKIAITRVYSSTIENLIYGELQDTEAAIETIGNADALTIAELKTASYSFVGPLKAGAILASLEDKTVEDLEKIGKLIGISFQLRDDWLGIFGVSEETGKSVVNDIREGKQTLLIEYAYDRASIDDKQFIDRHFGNLDASLDQITKIKSIIEATNAKRDVESLIEEYTNEAKDILEATSLPETTKLLLRDLSNQLLNRQK